MLNRKLKLKKVEMVSFARSELTSYEEFVKKNPTIKLTGDDVVCFLSMGFDQCYFVYGFSEVESRRMLTSVRVRCCNGAFSPLMLQDYANKANITLSGFPTFKERYEAEWAKKMAVIAKRRAQRERAKIEAAAVTKTPGFTTF